MAKTKKKATKAGKKKAGLMLHQKLVRGVKLK